MILIVLSLIVNILVAGYMGVAIGFSLQRALPGLDEVFGQDTTARRILACLYLSIATTSIVGVFNEQLRLPIISVLFPIQILYKVLTLFFVTDRKNPVPWCNLAISGLHAASLYAASQISE